MVKYALGELFGSLSDETRRDILRRLLLGEQTVSQLADAYHISLVAVSKHIKVLEASGLVAREKRGRQWFIRLSQAALTEASEYLLYYEATLHYRLDSFAAYLHQNHTENQNKMVLKPRVGQPQSVVVTEILDVSPEVAWQSYIDPVSIKQWWSLPGAQLIDVENDVRVGGMWRFTVQGAHSHTYILSGVYNDVKSPSYLEYSDGIGEPNGARLEAHVIVTFESLANDKTLLTKTSSATPAVHQLNAAWYRAIGGG